VIGEKKSWVYGLYLEGEEDRIRYVGKTSSRRGLKGRLYSHVWLARNSNGQLPVQRWINKHGGECIRIRSLYEVSEDDLDEEEVRTISEYRSLGLADLNVTSGGDGRTSEEVSGERNPRAKTTWEQVRRVRMYAKSRYVTVSEASKLLGTNPAGASKVLTNRSWYDPEYDPADRVTTQQSASRGEYSSWGRPTDETVNHYRDRYLAGESVSELVRSEGVPTSTMRRYLFDCYGDSILRGRCALRQRGHGKLGTL